MGVIKRIQSSSGLELGCEAKWVVFIKNIHQINIFYFTYASINKFLITNILLFLEFQQMYLVIFIFIYDSLKITKLFIIYSFQN